MRVNFTANKTDLDNQSLLFNANNGTKTSAVPALPFEKELITIKVSAVIITYNEEQIIKETISRLWWCDEIIIVDSGSTDKTVELCEKNNCKVYSRKFNGFGEQKNFGVSKANNDWILCIDADEILTDELVHEIQQELYANSSQYAGYSVPRNLVFMNKVFKYGKEANSSIIRLFNKTKGQWDGAVVHEKVCLKGPIKQLKNKILHYSYKDYSNYLDKINLYTTLGAQKQYAQNSKKNKLIITLGLPFNFLKYYLLDRNFLNGYRGFSWSVLSSIYHFLKYLKLEELRDKNG